MIGPDTSKSTQQGGDDLTPQRLRESVARAAGKDFGIRDATWLSRFGNATRQPGTYRKGRVVPLAIQATCTSLPAALASTSASRMR